MLKSYTPPAASREIIIIPKVQPRGKKIYQKFQVLVLLLGRYLYCSR